MKISKKKIVSTLFLGIITFSLFISLFSTKGISALSDITYDLNKEVLYNDGSIFPNDYSFNLDDSITSYTENYNASYSFANDSIESHPDHFISLEPDTSQIGVIANLDGHNKVVRMNQTTGSTFGLTQDFESAQDYGTIEFWFRSTDVDASHVNYFWLQNGASYAIYAYAQSDKFRYYDGAHKDIPNVPIPLDNVWFHIKIDFELTVGSYLGMNQYESIFTINGISSGAVNLASNQASVDNMFWRGSGSHTNYGQFLDALGYSWLSNYTINDNLLPFSEISTDLHQISAYEFCFEDIDDKYEIGEIHPESWETFQTGSGDSDISYDYSSLIPTGTFYTDRVVRMDNQGISTTELGKTDLGITTNFINITMSLNISLYDQNADYITIQMEADVNDLIDLRIYKTGGSIRLSYFDGGYTLIYDGLNLNDIYEFNVLLNLEIDQAFIILYENSVNIGYFQIPFSNLDEGELDTILFYCEGTIGNRIRMDIDYVGIFNNGITAVEHDTSYGYTQIKFNTNWNFKHHNLFTLRASGLILPMNFISADNIVYPSEGADDKLDMFREYTNTTKLNNLYEIEQLFGIGNSGFHDLILYTKQNISYDYINIEGVSLNENSNKYWLEQSYSEINSNESYFYVDDNSKLQFIHIANDTNLEYIQAVFNITELSSNDYAIKYRSDIDNNGHGYFRVNFTDISNFIPIPIYDTTTRVFITQNKTISSFVILITDDNVDTITGLTEGFVSEIQLLYVVGIGVSITTTNLLTIIIPLIIIFIPTFLLSSRLSKSTIVPLVMLMSLMCMATEIIPLWLFFIIVFPLSLFLFLKRGELLL